MLMCVCIRRRPKHRIGGSPGVLQQVFVLPASPGELSLSGISVQYCDENDLHDADFCGSVEVGTTGAAPACAMREDSYLWVLAMTCNDWS